MNEVGIWSITTDGTQRLVQESLNLERDLEGWVEKDPSLVESGLVIIGRQMPLGGGRLDLLGLDLSGNLVIIEIKRGALDRDTVSQALDYASSLMAAPAEVLQKARAYMGDKDLGRLLKDRGVDRDIEGVRIILVGTGRDSSLERVATYLSRFGVPLTVVSFSAFTTGSGERILVRQLSESEEEVVTRTPSPTVEELLALADQHQIGRPFRRIYETAQSLGLYPRVHKKSIMYTASTRRNRMLFTAWAEPKSEGKLTVYVGVTPFAELFPVGVAQITECIGEEGWRTMTEADVVKFLDALRRLFLVIENGQEAAVAKATG